MVSTKTWSLVKYIVVKWELDYSHSGRYLSYLLIYILRLDLLYNHWVFHRNKTIIQLNIVLVISQNFGVLVCLNTGGQRKDLIIFSALVWHYQTIIFYFIHSVTMKMQIIINTTKIGTTLLVRKFKKMQNVSNKMLQSLWQAHWAGYCVLLW